MTDIVDRFVAGESLRHIRVWTETTKDEKTGEEVQQAIRQELTRLRKENESLKALRQFAEFLRINDHLIVDSSREYIAGRAVSALNGEVYGDQETEHD